jgi:hypothetical protein
MQNLYYNQLFSIYSGYVYQFIGSVTDVDMTSITVEFITEADNAQASTSVCQLPNGSYLLHSFENIDSEKFKKIADLNYREPVILEPDNEATVDPQGEE